MKFMFKQYKHKVLFFSSLILASALCIPTLGYAADAPGDVAATGSILSQPGIIGTLVLAGIVLIIVCVFVVIRLNNLVKVLYYKSANKNLDKLKDDIINLSDVNLDDILLKRQAALQFKLRGDELS